MRSIAWFVDCLPRRPFADRELQRAIVFILILMLKPPPPPVQRESPHFGSRGRARGHEVAHIRARPG
jgi:hypothetical protein